MKKGVRIKFSNETSSSFLFFPRKILNIKNNALFILPSYLLLIQKRNFKIVNLVKYIFYNFLATKNEILFSFLYKYKYKGGVVKILIKLIFIVQLFYETQKTRSRQTRVSINDQPILSAIILAPWLSLGLGRESRKIVENRGKGGRKLEKKLLPPNETCHLERLPRTEVVSLLLF